MEGISGGLAVDLLAPYREQLWMERPARCAREVGVNLTTIVLDKGNGHVRGACARNKAFKASQYCGAIVYRHRRLELVHLGINNEQHSVQRSKSRSSV